MIKKLTACVFVWLALWSCSKKPDTNYSSDAKGYYYKLLSIGDGKAKPEPGNILLCDVTVCTLSDSVFFNSKQNNAEGFYIKMPGVNEPSGKFYFLKLTEGDSVSLMIKPECFFRDYFDTLVPQFCKHDSLVKLNVKIKRILTDVQYKNSIQKFLSEPDDKELLELQSIDDYLKANKFAVDPDNYGLYTLEQTKTTGEKVSAGKRIKVSYQGTYLDGKPADLGSIQFEFIFGTPDQLVKGLNIVIGNLKKGETIKIIVPSRLAFGELGSSNGSIPPYTPLVYNIKLIDIK